MPATRDSLTLQYAPPLRSKRTVMTSGLRGTLFINSEIRALLTTS